MEIYWLYLYCPICKEYVYPVKHIYPDRVEYVCPNCGRILEVIHKVQKEDLRYREP